MKTLEDVLQKYSLRLIEITVKKEDIDESIINITEALKEIKSWALEQALECLNPYLTGDLSSDYKVGNNTARDMTEKNLKERFGGEK